MPPDLGLRESTAEQLRINRRTTGQDHLITPLFKLAIVLTQPIWVIKVGVNRSKTVALLFTLLGVSPHGPHPGVDMPWHGNIPNLPNQL
jgi:hypothetical protein